MQKNFRDLIPSASKEAISLIKRMLTFESSKRISATQMLSHPYFSDVRLDSGKEKKEKPISVKTNINERKKRDSSYHRNQKYYENFITKTSNHIKNKFPANQ